MPQDEKQGKLTVEKPSTHVIDPHAPHIVTVSGKTEKPGQQVTISTDWQDQQHHATSGPGGQYGANVPGPEEPGVHTISVNSTEATTTTTFPARLKKK